MDCGGRCDPHRGGRHHRGVGHPAVEEVEGRRRGRRGEGIAGVSSLFGCVGGGRVGAQMRVCVRGSLTWVVMPRPVV